MQKIRSRFIASMLSVCLVTNSSCVKYSATSYEAIQGELKSYSPTVRVHHANGEKSDMQVLKVTEKSLSGYSTSDGNIKEVSFARSSIASLSQSDKTKFGVLSSKVGKAILVGGMVVLVAYASSLDDESPVGF